MSADTLTEADLRMKAALSLAETAASCGEVPVGALIVLNDEIIATGYNRKESLQQAHGHAEFLAILQAQQLQRSWRLSNCDLYVTLEPCLMCAGLIYQSRIRKVIFGAFDPKAGAFGSLFHIQEDSRLNHKVMVRPGVLAEEAGQLLKDFFRSRRKN